MAKNSIYWKQYDRSKMFSQMDVFYDYLGSDPNNLKLAALRNMALNSFDSHLDNIATISKNVEPYRRIAEYEKEKELELLREVFGQELHISLDSARDTKVLIDAINAVLNIKDVYERNLEMLTVSEGGRKSVISFFPTYFIQVWNDRWEEIYEATVKTFSNSRRIPLEAILQKEVDKRLDSIIAEAIERMLQADLEMKLMQDENNRYKNAYKEILAAFQTMSNYRNELINQIRSIYKIDELSKTISDEIKGNGHITKKEIEKKLKNSPRKAIETQSAPRGGLTLEALEHLSFELIGNSIEAAKGMSAKAIHTGNIGNMKADNIFSIGIDPQILDQWLEDITQKADSSRKKNIERMKKLRELTKNVNEGFLVYSSDKNYTLNKAFRDRFGFSAGSDLSAQSFYDVIRNVNKNARTFIGLMVNTLDGAIMSSGGTKEKLSEAIATDIATLLFDDYETIGDFRGKSGAKVIHIMNLGNIMVPLSIFLTMLANAVERAETDVDDFVKVVITTPEIEFKDYAAQLKWQLDNDKSSSSAWTFQRGEALRKTHISVNFFKEFREFITTLGK